MTKLAVKETQFHALVAIPVNGIKLDGMLVVPVRAKGVVLFVHGSGSSRLSPRNNFVAGNLNEAGYGTLLMDLLTKQEDATYENRFDIDLLTWRLERVTQWLMEEPLQSSRISYFGSTGAAAALDAAAALSSRSAPWSRAGRGPGDGRCQCAIVTYHRRWNERCHKLNPASSNSKHMASLRRPLARRHLAKWRIVRPGSALPRQLAGIADT
jgi:dienelactone hydrolase